MRASRPEGFTAHSGISNWQFPYGMTLEEILRAGTAPIQEEKTPKRGHNQLVQRNRKPVRALAIKPNTRPKYKQTEVKAGLKIGDLEDDFDEKPNLDERPPCRQNVNLFDLEDSLYPVNPTQKFNGFIKDSGRSARGEQRPPSRHKTPPKAVGLELPPKRVSGDFIPVDHMYQQDSPLSEMDHESFSNTMPVSFNEGEKGRKKNSIFRDSPAEPSDGKLRIKPKSAKGTAPEKMSIRMWSAAGKPKKKFAEVPISVNKKEGNNLSFSSSRREKIKAEEEKKEIHFEDKRKTYFKKVTDKRAQSSNNKPKLILPFQTNLEPEFLNLFAKAEDFNF